MLHWTRKKLTMLSCFAVTATAWAALPANHASRIDIARKFGKTISWAELQSSNLKVKVMITEQVVMVHNIYLRMYFVENHSFPDSLDPAVLDKKLMKQACDSGSLGMDHYLDKLQIGLIYEAKDSWGRALAYEHNNGLFTLTSAGANGILGGDILDDIGSSIPWGTWRLHYAKVGREIREILELKKRAQPEYFPEIVSRIEALMQVLVDDGKFDILLKPGSVDQPTVESAQPPTPNP